jgi:hypothetical protein
VANKLTIQGNGTSLGSYDGSSAKTINITYSNVGAAAASHNHSAGNITSGTLPIARGGTGGTTAATARANLGAAKGADTSAATAATAGWYRIATSAANISNCMGTFEITGAVSGAHSTAIVTASTSYGKNSDVQALAVSHFSGKAITKARIVYHATYSGNYAYLEVYNPNAKAITITVNMLGGSGWTLVAPSTAGSVPSGYSNKEIELANCTITTSALHSSGNITTTSTTASTSKTTGALKVAGGAGIAGRMSANEVMVADEVVMQYDSTLKAMKFVF